MKILTVVGARPQFVKAAALSRELQKRNGIEEVIVHTGQHFDEKMSDVFFSEMQIPKPKHNLHINSLGHGAMTGRMLEGVEELLLAEKPDMLLVYGDTNSTIAGALAAKKLHIPVGHVEAGLRSFNMEMPEEINRILTDRISDLLLCPTKQAISNLNKEGFEHFDAKVTLVGDVMQDAAMYYATISGERASVVKTLDLSGEYALVTVHRAENTDDPERLNGIVNALNEIHHSGLKVILPLHPRTKKVLERNNLKLEVDTIDPVGYFDMVELLKNASLVMTDSGGLQKEAFFFSQPCITLRDQTEWVELIDNGVNVLAGASEKEIVEQVEKMRNIKVDNTLNLYGGGKASANIADELLNWKA